LKKANKIKPNFKEASIKEIQETIDGLSKMDIPKEIYQLQKEIENTSDKEKIQTLKETLKQYQIFEKNTFHLHSLNYKKRGSVEKI
jgi:uncharacterized Zn finger protein (UPF0148 family)